MISVEELNEVHELDLPDDSKSYFSSKISPLVVDLSHVVMQEQPENPAQFLMNWLYAEKKNGNKTLVAENSRLRDELTKLKQREGQVSACAITLPVARDTDDMDDEEEEGKEQALYMDVVDVEPMPASRATKRGAVSMDVWMDGKTPDEKGVARLQRPKTKLPEIGKLAEQRHRLRHLLKKSFTSCLMSNVTERELETLILAVEQAYLKPGDYLLKQAQNSKYLYIVERGTLECRRRQIENDDGANPAESKVVKICTAGDMIGELCILHNTKSAVTVVAREASTVYKLNREHFLHVVSMANRAHHDRVAAQLKRIPVLNGMSDLQISKLVDGLEEVQYSDGAVVVRQGQPGRGMYVVHSGTLRAETDGRPVTDFGPGHFFGELTLIRNYSRKYTVVATSNALLLHISRAAFTRMFGSWQHMMMQKV